MNRFCVIYHFLCFSDWNLNTNPVRILGDRDEPHSTAIIVGRKTVVACAHSLGVVLDESARRSKSNPRFKYVEDYWIQPKISRTTRGLFTDDERIPIALKKFNVDNDWALFTRSDGLLFDPSEVASIDMRPIQDPGRVFLLEKAAILHSPVSLLSGLRKAGEYSVGCQISSVSIQNQSTHHVKYEGRDLCRGSSGGGVYVYPSQFVLGIHLEAINEAEFSTEVEPDKLIALTDMRVNSEEKPYEDFDADVEVPATKKLKSASESLASVAGGNNGLGSALVFCKIAKLIHYLEMLEA